MNFLQGVGVSKVLMLLGLVIVVDFVSGVVAAKLSPDDEIKSKKWNDGLIRKGNMIFAAFSCFLFDLIFGFNLIEFIPFREILTKAGLTHFGLAETISLGFIVGEVISIFENWKKADIKIPNFILKFVEKMNQLLFNKGDVE